MERLMKMAELLVERSDKVKAIEQQLKDAKKALSQIEREDLPTLMKEYGMEQVVMSNGKTITLKEGVDARITDETRAEAFSWLVDHGFAGLIKTAVSVTFPRGDHDEAVRAREDLAQRYDGVELKEEVHHSTLKAFVREQLQKGTDIPFEPFHIYPYDIAVVKG